MSATATTVTPGQVFEQYFAELERRDIAYVILHSYDQFPHTIATDVDYAVAENDRRAALDAHQTVAQACGWVVAQRVEYEIFATSALLISPFEPTANLRLDVTSHFTRNSCFYLPDSFLLEGRRRHGGFFVPTPATEFCYVLVKTLAKGKDVRETLPRLRELWSADRSGSDAAFTEVFGPAAGSPATWLNDAAADWRQLRHLLDARHRYDLSQKFADVRRRLRRIRRPVGLRMAVLGPDGTGKSSLVVRLDNLLKSCFRQQRIFHFCPRLFRAGGGAVVTRPHDQPPRNVIAGHLKILYYFVDHWLGFLFQQWPAIVRRYSIVFDRNFDDLMIDPRRYRLQHTNWLVRLLRRWLSPFDRTFVLDADPAQIHARKPELPVEELARQRAALQALAANDPRFVIVSAAAAPDEVAHQVVRNVIEFMAEREQRRPR